MNEVWKSWRDGTYEVSDLGNVRRAKPGISTYVGRPLLPCAGPTGYAMVQLVSDGKSQRVYVHHAVIEAFVGCRPSGMVVNHIDCNPMNNALANLEYVTQKQNVQHALAARARRIRAPVMPQPPKKGRASGDAHWTKTKPERIARADRMPHSKLTQEIVNAARQRAASGEKQCNLAREYGVSVAQMSRVIRGTRWTAE